MRAAARSKRCENCAVSVSDMVAVGIMLILYGVKSGAPARHSPAPHHPVVAPVPRPLPTFAPADTPVPGLRLITPPPPRRHPALPPRPATGRQQVGSVLARDLHYRIHTLFALVATAAGAGRTLGAGGHLVRDGEKRMNRLRRAAAVCRPSCNGAALARFAPAFALVHVWRRCGAHTWAWRPGRCGTAKAGFAPPTILARLVGGARLCTDEQSDLRCSVGVEGWGCDGLSKVAACTAIPRI